jgi:arginine exporter protein ArgO
MNTYYWIVLAIAAVLALPVLIMPQGWVLAAVLIGGWLALSIGGRWLASEYIDLKKQRETGMTTKKVTDKIGRTDDDKEWRR